MKSLITGVAAVLSVRISPNGSSPLGTLGRRHRQFHSINYPRPFKEKNLAAFSRHDKFRFLNQDLLQSDLAKLLHDVSYVFHLASQPGVRSSWGREFTRYTENNITATQLLLEASKVCHSRSSSTRRPHRSVAIRTIAHARRQG